MDAKTQYKLNESGAARRLADFREDDNAATLKNEIALCKTLIESAVNSGAIPLARDLMAVQASLIKAARVEAIRTGDLLDKRSLRKIGDAIVEIVCAEFEDSVPDFNERIDRVIEKVAAAIAEIKNDEMPNPEAA